MLHVPTRDIDSSSYGPSKSCELSYLIPVSEVGFLARQVIRYVGPSLLRAFSFQDCGIKRYRGPSAHVLTVKL